jgi:hypothetical protein
MFLAKHANMQPMMQCMCWLLGGEPHNLPYRKQLHGLKTWGQGGLNGSESALMQDYPSRN